jgi:hypothetical protein
VAKFADMTAKETAKEHGWQLKEATAHQSHRIRQQLATGALRDFHESKTARLSLRPFSRDVNPRDDGRRALEFMLLYGIFLMA